MRLLIEVHHPAHIHFFKNAIREWVRRGTHVKLIGRDRDVMRRLLQAYDYIPSEIGSIQAKNNHFPLAEMVTRQARVAEQVFRFGPDLVLSLMGSYTQPAAVLRVPSFIFTDSEFQHFNHRIAHPFATRIYTPECFWKDLGPKQRRYKGYHELAFLHPDRFTPRESILAELGLPKNGYVVVRVSAWDTLHDVGQSGFGGALDEFLEAVTQRYPVLIVPERGLLPERWQHLKMQVAPEYFHDVLAFARFVVSEGASTAAEAACLGVPSIYLNTTSRGYLDDMERRYGLTSCHTDARSALDKVYDWLQAPPDLERAARARAQLVSEHLDVTDFVIREVDAFLAG
jgi:uncharacterized protein